VADEEDMALSAFNSFRRAVQAGRYPRLNDRFEADWKTDREPRIEDFLDKAAEPDRAKLLHELLALEVDLRRVGDERPTVEEYCDRFPNSVQQVEAAFASLGTDQTTEWTGDSGKPEEPRALHVRCPHCQNPIEILDADR